MTKIRYFIHKCRSCGAEKLVRVSKTAQHPLCNLGHGRMPYTGVQELTDEEFSVAQPHGDASNDLTLQAVIEADYLP